MHDLIAAIVNGDPEFNARYADLLKGLGTETHADLAPIDFHDPEMGAGVHQTLKAILEHLKTQGSPKQKVVQVVRDQTGRLAGAKVVETE